MDAVFAIASIILYFLVGIVRFVMAFMPLAVPLLALIFRLGLILLNYTSPKRPRHIHPGNAPSRRRPLCSPALSCHYWAFPEGQAMISDFHILGVEEDADLASIKSACRKRAKELHPDLAGPEDALARHDLFMEVCKAYGRLMDGKKGPGRPRAKVEKAPHGGGEVRLHPDQTYVFYKQGMKFHMAVHPSHWNLDASRTG